MWGCSLFKYSQVIFSSSRGSEGVGFAIPINRAKAIIGDLINTGEVVKAWVGMRLARITPIVAQGLGLEVKNGLIVASVDSAPPVQWNRNETVDIVQLGVADDRGG